MIESGRCVFCEIAQMRRPASTVYEDDLTMAFADVRQFNPGHTLVIPREPFPDVRELDPTTSATFSASRSTSPAAGCQRASPTRRRAGTSR